MEGTAMKCIECGTTMKTTRENVKYDAVGLPGITLRNIEVRRCKCGETEYVIPDIEGLHRAIAAAVIEQSVPLAGPEIRFLRKHLGWSGVDFAEHMGATPETVSRWEHGRLAMSAQADRLLRTMVALKEPVQSYSLDLLKAITSNDDGQHLKVGLTRGRSGWTAEAA
jgi:putative zinc finger/helix-turn-helix YgiT family protein